MKFLKKVLLSLLVIVLVVYGAGAFYFTQTTFPNTTINGHDKSFTSLGNLFEFQGSLDPISVKGRGDKSVTINPQDINLQKKVKAGTKIEQNVALWPLAFFQDNHYKVEYDAEYDAEKLQQVLDNSDLMRFQEEPKDAHIIESENGYAIAPEEQGTTIDTEKMIAQVEQAVAEDKTEITLSDDAYVKPQVTAEDPELKEQVENANKLYETKIVYDFDDRQYEFTGQELRNLYDQTEDGLIINYDRARDLIRQMAVETDTFEGTRHFKNSHGEEIDVSGGIYGWLMDVDATTEEFIGFVENRESIETTPFYITKAMHRGEDDLGNTYIEVDLTTQFMWIYLNGELIDSDYIVSGQPSLDAATPKGVNYIRDKETERYLKGISPETGEEYDTLVNWWFPINWTDVGIHNSTWRTEYGGDIYLWNGSYACITVPDHLAITINDQIPIGTPVITY